MKNAMPTQADPFAAAAPTKKKKKPAKKPAAKKKAPAGGIGGLQGAVATPKFVKQKKGQTYGE
jgi:hypothetical protein